MSAMREPHLGGIGTRQPVHARPDGAARTNQPDPAPRA
jgi:hypothetical protein